MCIYKSQQILQLNVPFQGQSTPMLKKRKNNNLRTFYIVDTAFSYEREFIVCSSLQDFTKGKGSILQLMCNAYTSFLLCVAVVTAFALISFPGLLPALESFQTIYNFKLSNESL